MQLPIVPHLLFVGTLQTSLSAPTLDGGKTYLPRLANRLSYSAFTVEGLIPFRFSAANAEVPFTDDVRATFRISKKDDSLSERTYYAIIDTGSCGLVFSAADLPDWNKEDASQYPKGWEFLSSSKILYSGRWIPRDILFTDGVDRVKAHIPILAVETKTHCPSYNKTTDKDVCPSSADGPQPEVTQMPTNIRVLGVGFGREHDGMPQGTPDKNAFINVQSIRGISTVSNPSFRSGYVLHRKGVAVGLTALNTANMQFSQLSLQEAYSNDPRDWAQVDGCVAVGESECFPGQALIDTGVPQMYATLPLGTPMNRSSADRYVLDDGSRVEVQVGPRAGGRYIAREQFTAGDADGEKSGVVPSQVRVTLARPERNPPHFNTGRHFLRKWQVAFDSVGGYFGLGEQVSA